MRAEAVVVLLVLAQALLARGLLGAGLPCGFDTGGHFLKVAILLRESFPDTPFGWNQYWYMGTPNLRYYPPLFTLATGLASLLSTDALLVFKLVVFLALALQPLLLWPLLRRTGAAGAVAASLVVFLAGESGYGGGIWAVTWAGLVPQLFGLPLMALAIWAALRLAEGGTARDGLVAGLAIGVAATSHAHEGYVAGVAASLTILRALASRRLGLRALGAVALAAVAAVAYWGVPLAARLSGMGSHNTWESPSPAEAWRQLLSGGLSAGMLPLALAIAGIAAEGRRMPELALVLALLLATYAGSLPFDRLPFGEAVRSQHVRYAPMAVLLLALWSGAGAEALARAGLGSLLALLLLVSLVADDDLVRAVDGKLDRGAEARTWSSFSSLRHVRRLASRLAELEPGAAAVGEFSWDAIRGPDALPTPHALCHVLPLASVRCANGNFDEGSPRGAGATVFSYLGSQPSQRTLDTARRWGVGWLGAATPQARSGLGAALGPGEAFGPLTLYRVPDAPPGVRGDGASVLSVERSAQRIAVRYRAGGEGSVRLSDSYDGAWTASVSSGGAARPAPVLADGEGMQVEVPPGEGEVVLSFGEGAWGAAGALLSLACLAGCALLLARGSAPAQSS